jgi:hypothetical protein
MASIFMDVDVALSEVPVNLVPLLDATDFKTIEDAVAYNAAGMALYWHFVTTAGAYTVTAVTPTSGGSYDWSDQGAAGIYTIEIPASGGASINNDTEGFGWFTGVATGVLPWCGPVICFRAAALNNLFIDDGNLLEDLFRLLVRSDAAIETDAAAALTRLNLDRGSGAGAFDNTATPTATLSSANYLYTARIYLVIDEANTQDEYTVIFSKNGVDLTAGVTLPTIQVLKWADGTDLIASTSLTEIGSSGLFKHTATLTARLTAGQTAIAKITATIDGSTRTIYRPIGRDSAA